MSAEVAADRPPDPGADRSVEGLSRGTHAEPPERSARRTAPPPGETAHAAGRTLTSCRVAALPILDHFLRRLRLEEFLRDHLPREDRRSPRPHRHRAAGPASRTCCLPRAPLRRRRVGRPARPRTPRADPGATAGAQRRPRRPLPRPPLRRRHPLADARGRDARGPRVRRRARRAAQRLDDHHLPRRLRGRGPGADVARAAPAGRHLGPQQGPPPRPQATALHPHRHPRRRRAGAVPGRERQRHRRPLAPAPPGSCSAS